MPKKAKSGVPGIRAMRGKWQYRFRLGGKDHSKLTDLKATTQNLAKAAQAMEEAKQRILKGLPAPKELLFTDAADRFVDWSKHEHRDKPNTWRRHRTSMASLKAHFDKRMIDTITAGDMEAYKGWRREDGIKEVTLRHDLHAASQLFQFARKSGWMDSNPLDGVTIPSDQDSRNEIVLDAQEEALYLKHAGTRPALHDFAVLSIDQGMRPEEILSLPKDAVNLDAGTVQIRSGKSRASRRTIHLTDASKRILGRRMAGESKWVFPGRKRGTHMTYSGLINLHNEVLEDSKLCFTPYSLRHTFATRLYERTKDIVTVARILGHADLKTVLRYVHVDDEAAKKAMVEFEAGKQPAVEVLN